MKKIVSSLALLALVSFAGPAHGFGMPKAPAAPAVPSGGSGGATPAAVDSFIASALDSEVLVRNASGLLGRAVLAKDEMDKIEQKYKAAQALTNPQEQGASLRAADADLQASLAKVNYEVVAKEDAAKWDAAKKENVKSAIHNLALGLLKDTELVASGKSLASGPPNPAIASRLPLLKETLGAIGGQVDGLTKVVGGAKSLMSVVKLDKLPTAASEKAAPASTFL